MHLQKIFRNSNFDDSGISLPVFPSRTNLKLHNISVTPKMVKNVIMNLDSSKASGPAGPILDSEGMGTFFRKKGILLDDTP